jgi:hypothetical protein
MATTLPDRDDWFQENHGFPRPDWGAINGWLRVFAKREELNTLWEQFTRFWLQRLRTRLGGEYAVAESENFQLLSELTPKTRESLLAFCESARARIGRVVGEVDSGETYGKHVILRFTDNDDYYAYISHFHADGEYASSGGIFLRDGYYHIAFPHVWSDEENRRVLAHELTHNLLVNLPLPLWLNEALAMAFESDLAGGMIGALTPELAKLHHEYWDEETIQEFWRGDSFSKVEGQELAYSLSQVLLDLIHNDIRPPHEEFRRFVLRADWGDAGAIAAREHLDIALENLVASFLGPGEWKPRPESWRKVSAPPESADQESSDEDPWQN